eukprot:6672_1
MVSWLSIVLPLAWSLIDVVRTTTPSFIDGPNEYYVSSKSSLRYLSVQCSSPNCFVICDSQGGCTNTKINASASTSLTVECSNKHSCQKARLRHGPSESISIKCVWFNACQYTHWNVNTTKQVNIECNDTDSDGTAHEIRSVCADASFNAPYAQTVNVSCVGESSCYNVTILANNTESVFITATVQQDYYSERINGEHVLSRSDIYALNAASMTLICNGSTHNIHVCYDNNIYVPYDFYLRCYDHGCADFGNISVDTTLPNASNHFDGTLSTYYARNIFIHCDYDPNTSRFMSFDRLNDCPNNICTSNVCGCNQFFNTLECIDYSMWESITTDGDIDMVWLIFVVFVMLHIPLLTGYAICFCRRCTCTCCICIFNSIISCLPVRPASSDDTFLSFITSSNESQSSKRKTSVLVYKCIMDQFSLYGATDFRSFMLFVLFVLQPIFVLPWMEEYNMSWFGRTLLSIAFFGPQFYTQCIILSKKTVRAKFSCTSLIGILFLPRMVCTGMIKLGNTMIQAALKSEDEIDNEFISVLLWQCSSGSDLNTKYIYASNYYLQTIFHRELTEEFHASNEEVLHDMITYHEHKRDTISGACNTIQEIEPRKSEERWNDFKSTIDSRKAVTIFYICFLLNMIILCIYSSLIHPSTTRWIVFVIYFGCEYVWYKAHTRQDIMLRCTTMLLPDFSSDFILNGLTWKQTFASPSGMIRDVKIIYKIMFDQTDAIRQVYATLHNDDIAWCIVQYMWIPLPQYENIVSNSIFSLCKH